MSNEEQKDLAPQKAYAEHLPERVKETILELSPKQAAALRFYTQRGSPGYGNKSKSCRLAGYSETTDASTVFAREDMVNALKAIRDMQADQAIDVMHSIAALAPDATEELMSQLEMGRDLDIIDPRDIFGDQIDLEEEADEARLKEINRHNRNVAHLAKERRDAAETLLAYAEGTPEQRVRMTREPDDSDLMEKLMELSDEEFEKIGKMLFGEDTMVVRDGDVIEIDDEDYNVEGGDDGVQTE